MNFDRMLDQSSEICKTCKIVKNLDSLEWDVRQMDKCELCNNCKDYTQLFWIFVIVNLQFWKLGTRYRGQWELQILQKNVINIYKIKIKEHKQKTKPRKNLRTMQVIKLKLIANYFDFSSRLIVPVIFTNQDSPILAVLLYTVSS